MNKYRVTIRFETTASSEEEAIAGFTSNMSAEHIEVARLEIEEEAEKRIGTLRTRQGIVGISPAEPGDPVYDTGSRYRIYMDDRKRAVDYYKDTLLPEIIFDNVS